MMTKEARRHVYSEAQAVLGELYSMQKPREVAQRSGQSTKEYEKRADDLLEQLVPQVLALTSSFIEAVHVIAEAQRDMAGNSSAMLARPSVKG